MKNRVTRGYEHRLLPPQEQFMIKRLQAEWAAAEKEAKKHERIKKAKEAGLQVGRTLLGLTLAAGVLTIAVVAPNAFAGVARHLGARRYFTSPNLEKELKRGRGRKYWHYEKIDTQTYRLTLTRQGKKLALRNALKEFKLHRSLAWDGRWRVAMFDIDKKHSNARDMLRRKLHEMGMHPLQESVFVFPYPCIEEITMWAELLGVQADVELFEGTFTGDREAALRTTFHL